MGRLNDRSARSGACVVSDAGRKLPAVLAASLAVLIGLAAIPARAASAAGFGITGDVSGIGGHAVAAVAAGYGSAVSIWKSTAAVGAPGADSGRGVVHVFARSGGAWHQQAVLTDPNARKGRGFGGAVAVWSTPSATFALIGATAIGNSGMAYVYQRVGANWRLRASLANPSTGRAQFGAAVAGSGSTAIVAAPAARNYAGTVYVFARQGSAWRLRATLTRPRSQRGALRNEFGNAVAISGSTLVIGQAYPNAGAGVAYVYVRAAQRWHLRATLAAGVAGNNFGRSVAVSGRTVIVGAPSTSSYSGVAYVFARSGTTWRRQSTLRAPHAFSMDLFGESVAVSGTRVLVGASRRGLTRCGSAYEFERSGSNWPARARVVNPGCSPGDLFGWSVGLSGRSAIIGAPQANHGAGAAYVQTVP